MSLFPASGAAEVSSGGFGGPAGGTGLRGRLQLQCGPAAAGVSGPCSAPEEQAPSAGRGHCQR